MANADSITTDPKIISGRFGLPKISIPEDITEDANGYFSFIIETDKGAIVVSSYSGHKWVCSGTVYALEAGGFLRHEWCPGIPGNGKIRQTVLFEAAGPRLVFGNKNRKNMGSPFIVIVRASKNKFEVELMGTNKQIELLSLARQKRDQRGVAERQIKNQIEEQNERQYRKEEKYNKYHHSPSLFKDESVSILKTAFNCSMEQLSGKYEFTEYGESSIWLDEQSMQEVLSAGARMFEAVRNAKVICHKRAQHLSIVK